MLIIKETTKCYSAEIIQINQSIKTEPPNWEYEKNVTIIHVQ